MQPPYAPNVVNQTVSYGGKTWKGNPGGSWYEEVKDPMEGLRAEQAALAAKQKAETDARFTQNKQDLAGFNTRFSDAVPKIIDDTSKKYELGKLLGISTGLGTRVADLRGNLSGTGAGGYANASQVDKAVSTRYLPQYNQAVSNLQTGTALAQNEQTTLLKPFEVESNLLNDRLAREATGYSQDQQRELDGLLERMRLGNALTIEEMRRATTLAQLEQDKYLKEKELAAAKQEDNRYLSGTSFYDTATGKWVTKPSTGGADGW